MDEGFILANKFRRVIFDELVSGETDIKRITKKNRMIPRVAQRVIDEFVTGGIVEKKGNTYVFTAEGKKLVETIGK
ncbi:MAG: winged helix-turn-helix domain-containing protein [Thermoplasmata archaeon]|jgi:predicted transcriptional regulator|nr:winged helix-turn-helix domain-containing protein [Thermoplasmata archaeon]